MAAIAHTTALAAASGDKHLRVEDVQEAYIEQKDRLVKAIDDTSSILQSVRDFNKEEWVVRYPQLGDSATPSKGRKGIRRSLSFADDPNSATDVVLSEKPGLTHSITLSSISDAMEDSPEESEQDKPGDNERLIPASDFQVLRLDLKLGASGAASAASLVSQLEKSSIANLLDERLTASLNHMVKLRARVEDTSSKVLVTGDLNAGKSTFVNALLRREVMPVDQQPCTTAFCEVHDAAENAGVEEVHIIADGVTYDIKDESTFTRAKLQELEEIVGENEDNDKMLKLYLGDSRAPSESLLNNGVVDISLIDAPGLNRDSLKTTALFARQEEIDVVVFVVSAENHFTLSSKEFLWNASNEKAYLFIVVNKYDQIKNKEKCRRLVLDQIKQLSPRTYDDAEDLVHFVDSASALQPFTANPSFDDMESSLRSFVLVKRSKSKLHPASTYLLNILADVELLAAANSLVAEAEKLQAQEELERTKPILERMQKNREALEENLELVEETGSNASASKTRSILSDALERVGQGKLAVSGMSLPTYPGILGIWDYARDVRKSMLASLDLAVKSAEDEARAVTSNSVDKIKELADEHLPSGVERNKRVFMPEAMFSAVRRNAKAGKGRRSSTSSAVVAGGIHGLGIGLAQRPEMLETTFLDLFDIHHHLSMNFNLGDGGKEEEATTTTALGLVSVGVGALTMVGGNAVGVRGLIEGAIRITDLLGNDTAKKWAAPVLGAFTIGMTAYFVMELPNSIPKTVGRRVRASVVRSDGAEEDTFIDIHSARISRETRKVLRLASWDLRGRFTSAMQERTEEVQKAEESQKRAIRAAEWFGDIATKTTDIRVDARLGSEL